MFGRRILATVALAAACAQAQLSITNPGPNSWWGTSRSPISMLHPSDFRFPLLHQSPALSTHLPGPATRLHTPSILLCQSRLVCFLRANVRD